MSELGSLANFTIDKLSDAIEQGKEWMQPDPNRPTGEKDACHIVAKAQQTAAKAKSAADAAKSGKCPACDKHGIPVLLTIPTLVEKECANKQPATSAKLQGSLPSLVAAGYAMRTLREGYVMAWYETHPSYLDGEEGWTLAEVHKGGYMTPTSFAAKGLGTVDEPRSAKLSKANAEFSCSRVGGYASALLFVVPKDPKISKVWVAFSSQPWSPQVRQAFAASSELRKKAMTLIDVNQLTCRTGISLSEEDIANHIIDYRDDFDASYIAGNPFPLAGLKEKQEDRGFFRNLFSPAIEREETPADIIGQARIAQNMDARGLETPKGLIVGLRDAEGLVATAAQRRISLCSSATEFLAKTPQGPRRLQSALMVKGLKKLLANQLDAHKKLEEKYRHLEGQKLTWAEFQARVRIFSLSEYQDKSSGDGLDGTLPFDAGFTYRYYAGRQVVQRMESKTIWPEDDEVPNNDQKGVIAIRSNDFIDEHAPWHFMENNLDGEVSVKGEDYGWEDYIKAHQDLAKADNTQRSMIELDHKLLLQSDGFKCLYQHQFSTLDPRDAYPYASMVAACLNGGPLTDAACGIVMSDDKKSVVHDKSKSWWADFLQQSPNNPRNLLVRALLGNQVDNFNGFSGTNLPSAAFDKMPNLLDSIALARQQGCGVKEEDADLVIASLISSLSALSAKRNSMDKDASTLTPRLASLIESLMAKSQGDDLKMCRVMVPLDVAVRYWRKQAEMLPDGVQQQTKHLKNGRVTSLIFGNPLTQEAYVAAANSSTSASAFVPVYAWFNDSGKLATDITGKTEDPMPKWAQKPFKGVVKGWIKGNAFVRDVSLTERQLNTLIEQNLLRVRAKAAHIRTNGLRVFVAGAAALQVWSLFDAGKVLAHGDKATRENALGSILSSGIGLVSALTELWGMAIEATASVAAKRLLFGAGIAGAISTAIAAAQAWVAASESFRTGDDNAGYASVFQGAFFFAASIVFVAAALIGFFAGAGAATSAVVASVTGVGLILVALGVITGFVVAWLKDKPFEAWADASTWGSNVYSNFQQEVSALNERLSGIKVEFSYGIFDDALGSAKSKIDAIKHNIDARIYNMALSSLPVVANSAFNVDMSYQKTIGDVTFSRLDLTLPNVIKDKLRWIMQIHATEKGTGKLRLIAQYGSSTRNTPVGNDFDREVYQVAHGPRSGVAGEENGLTTLTLSASLGDSRYGRAYATVRVGGKLEGADDPLLQKGRLLIGADHIYG